MILLLWASPNQDGLTAAAKKSLYQGICSVGVPVESIQLNRCHIQACQVCGTGWGMCRSSGKCIIQDDFYSIYQKMEKAHGYILVTPVYWHDIAEPLKCFLDRLRRCETKYNHKLYGGKCLLVACAGGSGRGGIQCLHKLEEIMGHMGIQTIDRISVNQFNKTYMLPALVSAGTLFAEETHGSCS